MAQACKIMMDQGRLAMRGLCAARRVSPWIRFSTQLGTLVIMPGTRSCKVLMKMFSGTASAVIKYI